MRRIFSLFLLSALLSACGGGGGSDNADNTIASIAITAGDSQTGAVGTELATGLTVTVLNKAGKPVTGQVVNFVVTAGGGTVFSGSASSDNNGQARERWTMGHTAGAQKLEVRSSPPGGTPSTYATFNATANAGPATALAIVSGDGQSAMVNRTLPQPLKVVAKDQYGNTVPGVSVTFTAAGADQVGTGTVTTDAAGQASTTWTLRAPSGSHAMTATATGLSAVTFSADAMASNAGIPATITIVSGDQQTVAQHAQVAAPVLILVADDEGTPVPGAWVEISAPDGDPLVSSQSLVAGADGIARWQGSFQVPGVQKLHVSVSQPSNTLPGKDFSVTVASSAAHPYDGYYDCQLKGGSQPTTRFVIVDGAAPLPGASAFAFGTLNEANGALDVYHRLSLDDGYRLTGTLTIKAMQVASGTGPFVEERRGVSGPFESGTWECARRP